MAIESGKRYLKIETTQSGDNNKKEEFIQSVQVKSRHTGFVRTETFGL